ncbi:MAG: hypothetical protein A2Z57_01290, partial [Planctomycetes bacterium RIFCSPHIGHO2_12_39_6]
MKPNKYLLTLTGFFMLTIVVGADFKQKSYDPFFRKGREENRLFSIWTPVEPFVEFKMFGGEVAYGQEEAPTVDYEKLGKKASKINANKNPDEVIELLAPYKDDRNNKSLTFYNNLGLAYIKQRRNNEAIALFKHALGSNPNEPTMHYNLAIAYYNNNQLDKALKHISMSLELRPSDEDTKKWREHISSKLKREITYYAEEKPKVTGESLDQLESQLQEEISKRKQAEEELKALGGSLEKLAAERTTELAKTTAQLQEEISKRKQAEEELKTLGESLEQLVSERVNEITIANTELHTTIVEHKWATEHIELALEKAKQLFDAKKYQEVVFILEPQYKIIAEESSETSSETDIEIFDAVKTVLSAAYVELSDSYFYANNIIMAEYAAREAVNVNPNNSWGYNNLGFLCSRKDEYQKAEEFLKRAISLDNGNSIAYNNLGYLYLRMNKVYEAETLLNKSIQLNYSLDKAHNNLATVFYYKGQYEDSLKELDITLELNPQNEAAKE